MKDDDLSDISILVIDEDPFLSRIMVSVLAAFGISALTEARSYDDAIAKLSAKRVDCVIGDWFSGAEDGLKYVDFIRRDGDSHNRQMPVIICTARTDLVSIFAARDKGVSEIIAKPFSPDRVLKKLLAALFRQREFVEGRGYVGPDRRCRDVPWPQEDRRTTAVEAEMPEEDLEMSKAGHG